LDEGNDGVRRFAPSASREAQQENPSGSALVGEHDSSEVFILGKEQPTVAHREVDDGRILRARRDFGDRENVVTGVAQSADDLEIAAFVGKEPHRPCALASAFQRQRIFVGERVRGVSHGCPYVFRGEARVSIE
jgi:hypothetical protein